MSKQSQSQSPAQKSSAILGREDFLKVLPAQSAEALLKNWLCKVSDQEDAEALIFEDYGALPLKSQIAVWHPLSDLYQAPKINFASTPSMHAVWDGEELLGYLFWTNEKFASWSELGDASIDTDRFFLVQQDQYEPVIDWFNDDLDGFEDLGSESPVEMVEHENGTRMLVMQSGDGNALISAGLTEQGLAALVVISAVYPADDENYEDEEEGEN